MENKNVIVKDNFLPEDVFKNLQYYCYKTDSKLIEVGEKLISIIDCPEFINEYLVQDGYETIASFVRESYDGFDNNINIHADNRLFGLKIALASVLYINPSDGVTINGTAFYQHEYYGLSLPDNVSDEEHDRLIIEDSNDFKKWKSITNLVVNKPNRFLVYPGNMFHGKVPTNIDKGLRLVLVTFYKKI